MATYTTPTTTPALNTIATFGGVQGYNNFVLANMIEDEYNSHLDLQQFCTVDNDLQGTIGTEKRINVYGASGDAEDVEEGAGNTAAISTTLTEKIFRIKCAQAWFEYTDEAYQRDPIAVQVGIAHLGTTLFNKVNADVLAAFDSATQTLTTYAVPSFDCFVDAQALLKLPDGAGENAFQAQQRIAQQTFAFLSKNSIAKARKALKDELKYVEAFATTGYVGTVAGTNLYYKQDLNADNQNDNVIYLATKNAVTIFNKTGTETEIAARTGGVDGSANKRVNDLFARKYYVVALTDATQAVKITLTT